MRYLHLPAAFDPLTKQLLPIEPAVILATSAIPGVESVTVLNCQVDAVAILIPGAPNLKKHKMTSNFIHFVEVI